MTYVRIRVYYMCLLPFQGVAYRWLYVVSLTNASIDANVWHTCPLGECAQIPRGGGLFVVIRLRRGRRRRRNRSDLNNCVSFAFVQRHRCYDVTYRFGQCLWDVIRLLLWSVIHFPHTLKTCLRSGVYIFDRFNGEMKNQCFYLRVEISIYELGPHHFDRDCCFLARYCDCDES